ncbi:nucleoside/nucleotide kinase family protein [Actinoalloteichus hymeniacidonis]|uniref:Uridine kinase n=1 Tax=Actinoalloteichus hymeniacidonis TaxID=340345 RepID=A0AAC9HPI0_9PSEU|nr:hypothetical protein [Actinoalloteichus hymeniacidonis]AOS63018.1 hypothetical protein TL08_11020 [Actinoalloteichus hymeniacidonis]MBB5908947.1 hypothetical protein [Actinoalloteichus hymeniacidonis]
MEFRSSTAQRLPVEIADWIDDRSGGRRIRLALDAPVAEHGAQLAESLVDELARRGRPALRVAAAGFLRPASLRWEHGRQDPDSYPDWLDHAALRREVLTPAETTGTGRILPSRWDPITDRATRADYVALQPNSVVIVDGMFLLDGTLDFDLTVHLAVSPRAMQRLIPEELQWTLPAHRRYATESVPSEVADLIVQMDHPERPAYRRRSR